MSQGFVVRAVATPEELGNVYEFAAPILGLPLGKHTLEYYTQQFAIAPQLMVLAERESHICGCVLASIEGDHVLVGPVAVAADMRRMGIGSTMMRQVEERARETGLTTLILGGREEAESFYLSCSFEPNLFVQLAEPDSAHRLKSLSRQYDVIWESQQDGWSRLMLRTPQVDRDLQREYQRRFPGCSTQNVFIKHL